MRVISRTGLGHRPYHTHDLISQKVATGTIGDVCGPWRSLADPRGRGGQDTGGRDRRTAPHSGQAGRGAAKTIRTSLVWPMRHERRCDERMELGVDAGGSASSACPQRSARARRCEYRPTCILGPASQCHLPRLQPGDSVPLVASFESWGLLASARSCDWSVGPSGGIASRNRNNLMRSSRSVSNLLRRRWR